MNRKSKLDTLPTAEIIKIANENGIPVPAFNIPYLPMMKPVVSAIIDTNTFALIEVARLEWEKFGSISLEAVMEEYQKWQNPEFMRIHLDHVPVIDEDDKLVDYLTIIEKAIDAGYQSVMVDGSRMSLDENIKATEAVVKLAHQAGIACEAELGAVFGHEEGPLPPYEELFESGQGFTKLDEAGQFVKATNCDWLSVAVGNIHGNISKLKKDQEKVQAKLDLGHIEKLSQITGIPLVLHGGSGVQQEYVLEAARKGMTKINIGTDIRQPYEARINSEVNPKAAQDAVYKKTRWVIEDYLYVSGSNDILAGKLK